MKEGKVKMRHMALLAFFSIIVFLFLLTRYFPLKYYDIIVQNCKSLDPLLVISVTKTESSFRENAESWLGAYGLMQLMPETAEWLNKKFKTNYDYKIPEDNIALGCLYLNYLMEKDGDIYKALVHYNTGPYASDEIKNDAGERYIKKVMRNYKFYKFLYRR